MKKLMSIVVMLAMVTAANGAVLISDNFDSYTVGTAVCDTDIWNTHSGTAGQITVDGSTGTNAAELTYSQGEDINAAFAEITSGILTATFDVYLTALPSATGAYFAHFMTPDNSFFRGRVFNVANGQGGFNFGIAYSGGSVYASTVTGYALNQWYSLQLDLNYSQQSATLTVLNTGESISETSTLTVGTMEAFALRQTSGIGNLLVDNVVVSYVPEPATMMLLGLGSLLLARKK